MDKNVKFDPIRVAVFWVVMPFGAVVEYHRFVGICCLHLQREVSGIWKRTVETYRGQPHSLHPEDEGNMVLRNVGILTHHYTTSQPRRRRYE
jgi:hypothetical protein